MLPIISNSSRKWSLDSLYSAIMLLDDSRSHFYINTKMGTKLLAEILEDGHSVKLYYLNDDYAEDVPSVVVIDETEYQVCEIFIACHAFGNAGVRVAVPETITNIIIGKFYKDRFGQRPESPVFYCPSHEFGVDVSDDNTLYESVAGSLFTKGRSTLIQLSSERGKTSIVPAGVKVINRGALIGNYGSLDIKGNVAEIEDGAFDESMRVQIFYNGLLSETKYGLDFNKVLDNYFAVKSNQPIITAKPTVEGACRDGLLILHCCPGWKWSIENHCDYEVLTIPQSNIIIDEIIPVESSRAYYPKLYPIVTRIRTIDMNEEESLLVFESPEEIKSLLGIR